MSRYDDRRSKCISWARNCHLGTICSTSGSRKLVSDPKDLPGANMFIAGSGRTPEIYLTCKLLEWLTFSREDLLAPKQKKTYCWHPVVNNTHAYSQGIHGPKIQKSHCSIAWRPVVCIIALYHGVGNPPKSIGSLLVAWQIMTAIYWIQSRC